jgi:hypothetical protein
MGRLASLLPLSGQPGKIRRFRMSTFGNCLFVLRRNHAIVKRGDCRHQPAPRYLCLSRCSGRRRIRLPRGSNLPQPQRLVHHRLAAVLPNRIVGDKPRDQLSAICLRIERQVVINDAGQQFLARNPALLRRRKTLGLRGRIYRLVGLCALDRLIQFDNNRIDRRR